MNTSSFELVAPVEALDRLPIRLEQSASRSSTVLWLLLLIPALAAIAIPLPLVAAHVLTDPAALALLSEHPVTGIQILAGFALWCVLFVRPLHRLLSRAGQTRLIEITPTDIRITDRGLLGTRTWSEPLTAFRGLAHHVRSTLSGVRHELVLVHPDQRRHVLLVAGPAITQTALMRAAVLLGLPEIPARAMYVADDAPASAAGATGLRAAAAEPAQTPAIAA